MKTNLKYFFITPLLIIVSNLYSYEIIRDPIFENYFSDISEELKLKKFNVYLINNFAANAFVIEDNIYFTTGLLQAINYEDTLKSIYFHEYGHIIKNHYEVKKFQIKQSSEISNFNSLISIGLAVLTNDTNLGIGSSITLNSNLINKISNHSVNFEIEADNFMIEQIKKNQIYTLELISFLNQTDNKSNYYFRTHPKNDDRVSKLKKFNYEKTKNSEKFNWIKSKYSFSSENQSFNSFFENLQKGIFNQDKELKNINKLLIQYEAYKKGFFIDNWNNKFQDLLVVNDNAFLMIEYINYVLDNNLDNKYYIIEDLKFNENIMNEFFYYYIYGKYYNKINKKNLSNFYFCQFYKNINSLNKADFFCEKYDIKDIPILDKSYALFK